MITGIYDIDNYLLKYLPLNSLLNLAYVNKYTNNTISLSVIYRQLSELKTVYKKERLEYVVVKGFIKIIKLYKLSRKIDNLNDINQLVILSSKYGQLKILSYLVSLGAVDIRALHNEAVQWASGNGHLETVRYLVSLGVDITASDNRAVRWASGRGHLETVRYLVSIGANITAENNYAVQFASENGHLETVRYLVSLGADITSNNNYAVRYASGNGHLETVRYLASLGVCRYKD